MRHLGAAWGIGAVIFAALLAGCGGGGGGSCGKIQPCGGDIRGRWTVVDACLNPEALRTQLVPFIDTVCPTAKVTSAELDGTGSFSFNPDMTYSAMSYTAGTVKMNVPESCLSGLNCSFLTLAIQLQVSRVPAVRSVSCAGTAGCVCTIVLNPIAISEGGTYRTVGRLVTTLPATVSGIAQSREYCVEGTRLHFMTVDRTTGQPAITGDMVAEKD